MRPTRAAWLGCAAAAAVLLALPATACSGSKGSGAHDAGATEDAPAMDAAMDAADAAADDAPGPVEAGPTGFVFFTTTEDGTGGLGAVFDGTPVPAASCQVTTVYGACVVYTCPSALDAGPTAGAGTLTFAAPSLDGGVTIDADPSGLYALATPGALFSAGDLLTVTASGGTVPAFGPAAVAAPGAITLTNPVPDGGAIAVPTSSDFGFAWTGGSIDSAAVLTASGVAPDGSLVVVRCSYVGITDEGILPSPVLAAVRGLSQGTLGWGQANTATVDAGLWSVTLLAGAYGSTPATFE
jgi:hypothetical protein